MDMEPANQPPTTLPDVETLGQTLRGLVSHNVDEQQKAAARRTAARFADHLRQTLPDISDDQIGRVIGHTVGWFWRADEDGRLTAHQIMSLLAYATAELAHLEAD